MRSKSALPKDLEAKLSTYREARRAETGKVMFRDTAISELLRTALMKYEPSKPVEARLADIETRLSQLESR